MITDDRDEYRESTNATLSHHPGAAWANLRIRLQGERKSIHFQKDGGRDGRREERRKGTGRLREKTCLVFLSWSLIFFSISASVRTWMEGPQASASASCLTGNLTGGRGASLREEEEEEEEEEERHEGNKTTACNTCFHMYTPEGIGPGMPRQLSSNGVCDGGNKLSSQAKICTENPSKIFRTVSRI